MNEADHWSFLSQEGCPLSTLISPRTIPLFSTLAFSIKRHYKKLLHSSAQHQKLFLTSSSSSPPPPLSDLAKRDQFYGTLNSGNFEHNKETKFI